MESPRYRPRFHVVLHQPEIAPNTGAVGRTCVALEARLWLVRPLGFRIDEKSLRRAGLDYWRHLDWHVLQSTDELVARQAALGGQVWMFSKTARRAYTRAGFQSGDWLVFGSETCGLPPSLLADPRRNLRIPVGDHVRSLNLSNAVAVAGYEVARQLDFFSDS